MLETARLVLRRLTEDDVSAYAALVGDPEVMRFIGGVRTAQEAAESIAALNARYEEDGFGVLGIERVADRRLIRRVGLWVWDGTDWTSGHTRRRLGDRADVELGWALTRNAWGYGFATEAAAAMRDEAFRQLRLTRLISLIHPENDRSVRVAHRLGAIHETDIETARWGPAHLYVQASPTSSRADGRAGEDPVRLSDGLGLDAVHVGAGPLPAAGSTRTSTTPRIPSARCTPTVRSTAR
jgi:RimJ/RimL family protein N-acetyltransferase